ncbi:MAG TPA: helix-turn-helix transcriptional regulator [Sphingomicrobium sp.]|nr:helix-turn-helix transcriptional regulator [Sphingomicrobium sp.]
MAQTYSRYAIEALGLLGRSIRAGRIERRMTTEELAQRIGISRPSLHRIERGDPTISIGSAFEAATIVGVPLFEADPSRLAGDLARVEEKLALLPKMIRRPKVEVDDDF